MSNTTWGKQHAHEYGNRRIPILVHADGAQVYRDSEFYIWTISSASVISVHQDVIDCKYQVIKIPCYAMKDSAGLTMEACGSRPRAAGF
jgi:hypothetical protein